MPQTTPPQSSEVYPLQVLPEFVERVWGTHDLSFLYQHAVGATPIGEVWLTGDACRIANGPWQGQTLEQVTQALGEQLLGANHKRTNRFPLLLKVLFPREKLSVQVHPDDEAAQRVNEACGKTECWYILKAEPGAQIGLGLQPGITKDEVERSIRENRMEQVLNWIDVRDDEMYYVDAGTVHAIGPNSIIVETQQNSDTTYRLYDYGRPRELHIEKGLAVTKTETHAGRVARDGDTLVACPYFAVERKRVAQPTTFATHGTVQCLLALDGAARIECPGAPAVTIARGEMALIPAAFAEFKVVPQWTVDLFLAHVPHGEVTEPETVLYSADSASVSRHS
jgi:mannose-6-phosphate isomerase